MIAFSPLARGFLVGMVQPRDAFDADDFRRRSPWWAPQNFDGNLDIVERLTGLSESKGATLFGWRSRGCWSVSRTSCQSPDSATPSESVRTSPPLDFGLVLTISPASTR